MSVCGTGNINKDLNTEEKQREQSGNILIAVLNSSLLMHNHSEKKDKHDYLTFSYSVKSVPFYFPPLGAIEGADA